MTSTSTSKQIGKVALTPAGNWDNTNEYEKLDVVYYQGGSYVAKKAVPVATNITNEEYWQALAEKAPSLTIGTVTTVSASTGASASIGGTVDEPTLNLSIPRGVAGNESIDDTAGEGDTDKVWSADKSYGEIGDLKNALTDITGNSVIPVTGEGKYIITSGATANINSPVSDARYRYYVASAMPGDMFTINAQGGSGPRTWAFVADNGTVLSKSLSSANCDNLVIKAPENSAYLVINSLRDDFSYYGQLLSLTNVGLFGDDLAVSFTAETVQTDTANLLARRTLAIGKYILRWRQVDNVQKHSINSRLGPLYKNANGQSTIYYDKFHTPWKGGVNYWIIDITSEEEYRFYMWGNDLSANCAIKEYNLFDANTPIGKIYLSLAENAAQKDKARFAPTMFKTVGFIGDSWTAGSIYDINSSYIGTFNDYSYATQMARYIGATPTIFAKGGLSAREWLTDSEGLPKLLNSPVQDMYWVNLGINDAGEITDGTESGVGVPSDYDNGVTGTFCYYMGQIVESIQEYAPNAVVVLCDILQLSANQIIVSNAIPMIADYYSLPYIRLYNDDFYRSEANHLLMHGAHPTILLHSGMAQANLRLLSTCIDNNTDKFNTFIPA